MEWLVIVRDLGFTPLNLVLGGMLYILLADKGLVKKFWKKDQGDGELAEDIPSWAEKLISNQKSLVQYANHNTTEHHEKTHVLLKEISVKMDRHNEMEKENHTKLEEILKYGVPCREK